MKTRILELIGDFKKNSSLHIMIIPGLILILTYSYLPLIGLKIAFEKFEPVKGLFGDQQYVGLKWFQYLFNMSDFKYALINTLIIAGSKLVLVTLTSIIFAILINEANNRTLKRVIQTAVYLPHFISWIILATVFVNMLSPSTGIVNKIIEMMGIEPIFFLGSNSYFRGTVIVTDVWKEFGFGTIVYLAAITGIDPGLYEAATIDGANKFKQIWHITLPSLANIIALMALLRIGTILGGNFDQIFNLYSPSVYRTGDILDTLVYRIGLVDYNFSLATAVGVFKSLVSGSLIGLSYFFAWKFANYKVF